MVGNGKKPVDKAKPFDIPKRKVWKAIKRVKANLGGWSRWTLVS